MILYQNSLMKLDFDPASKLMEVNWPGFKAYTLPDARTMMSRLLETIKNYDVKKLLVNTAGHVKGAEEFNFDEIITQFITQLQKTKVDQVARLKTSDTAREMKAASFVPATPVPIRFQNFDSREEALEWLLNKTNGQPA